MNKVTNNTEVTALHFIPLLVSNQWDGLIVVPLLYEGVYECFSNLNHFKPLTLINHTAMTVCGLLG